MQSQSSAFDREFWNDSYKESGTPLESEPEGLLVREVEALTPGTALDLGCGIGVNSIYLAERGWQVTGVDWADEAIKRARSRASDKELDIQFVAEDAGDWIAPHQFDLVVSTYALPSSGEHRQKVLKNAVDAVAPGGTLLVIEWDRSMAHKGFWEESDLVSVDELAASVTGLVVDRAELVEIDFAKHRASESSEPHEHVSDEGERFERHIDQDAGNKWFAALVRAHRPAGE